MKFDLAIVEDEDVLNLATDIAGEAIAQLSNVVFNADISKEIKNYNYREVLSKYEGFEGNLIILLDMQLDIIRTEADREDIMNRFDKDYGIARQQIEMFVKTKNASIDGILIAEKAILNKEIKKILIIPFTKAENFAQLKFLFPQMIKKLGMEKNVFFHPDTMGAWSTIKATLNPITDEKDKAEYKQRIIKFITDAVNGFQKEFRNPVEKLCKELIRGCQVEGGHPSKIKQIPTDTINYDILAKTEKPLENFKALYYPEDSRGIDADLFSSIFKFAGIEIQWKTKPTKRFCLPTRPGMVFIICMVNFLQQMDKSQVTVNSSADKNGKLEITFFLKLADPDRFKEGIFTGGGKGIDRYRNLLGCKNDIICNYLTEGDKMNVKLGDWSPLPMGNGEKGNSTIYKRCLKGKVNDSGLILSWISKAS